jgi:hypothetical protein
MPGVLQGISAQLDGISAARLTDSKPLAGSVLTGVPSATQADEGNAGIPIVVKVGAGLGGVGVLGLPLHLVFCHNRRHLFIILIPH